MYVAYVKYNKQNSITIIITIPAVVRLTKKEKNGAEKNI